MATGANQYDAVVIGGGHNGLIHAAYLARAGRKVVVLERRHVLGGAAVSEQIFPGFTYSVCSYVVSLMRPDIIRELDLSKHGLQILPLDCSFSPYLDGRALARWGDGARTRQEIARFSPRDAEIAPRFGKQMGHLARLVKDIIDNPPPDPTSFAPEHLGSLARLGKRFSGMGEDHMAQMVKLMTMSSADLLDEWFESDQLKAPMSVSGIIGTFLGVRSPGTAYVMLHHYMGEIDGSFRAWGFARGGTGEVSMACARAALAAGAEIRTEAAVDRILVQGGQAKGVVLHNGEEIHAKAVCSGVDPHRTFLRMVGHEHLHEDFTSRIGRFRMRGSSGKVNLAVDRPPNFTARPGDGPHIRGDIAIAPSVDYLERAYDEAKYGDFSKRPYINMVIPSLTDPSVAPPGKHVVSCFVQYAPYELADGPAAWPDKREAFGDAVCDTIEEHAPGFKDSILHRQVVTPWDMEQDYGLTEGNIFHGELGLEQLFFLRPVPECARYHTPIEGLWLAASGAHPGGGLMGAPGKLSAQALLESGQV